MAEAPQTHYVKSNPVHIACQILGDCPLSSVKNSEVID
jgi:hypothetical protein